MRTAMQFDFFTPLSWVNIPIEPATTAIKRPLIPEINKIRVKRKHKVNRDILSYLSIAILGTRNLASFRVIKTAKKSGS